MIRSRTTSLLSALAIGVGLLLAGRGAAALAQDTHQHTHPHDGDRSHSSDSDTGHDATVHHSFEDVDRWVKVFDDPARAEWQKPDEVAAALRLEPGSVLLDIGAGTGYFNAAFARRVREGGIVFAADVEPSLIAHMLKRARLEETPEVCPLLIPTDEPRIPVKADVVFICDTYHHIDDRLSYLAKVRDVLEPGGIVAIIDFKLDEIPVGPSIEHRIDPDFVIEEMEAAGFRLSRRETILPYQYFLIFEIS